MPRPRKAETEKLVPVKTGLTPERERVLRRRAEARGVPLAVILREYLDPAFRVPKNTAPAAPS